MDGRRPPPEMSNFYCLAGRAGGTPIGLDRVQTANPRSWVNAAAIVESTCEVGGKVECETRYSITSLVMPAH
jgi:hypothetical protein